MAEIELIKSRIKKLEELKNLGIEIYPTKFDVTHKNNQIKENFDKLFENKQKVKTAGRIILLRLHGKAGFANLKDDTGIIQIYIRLDFLGEQKFNLFKNNLDIGDIIGVEGEVFKTHTGEITIKVEDFKLLAKSLRPLPEKWHGLTDIELKYRLRYLDLIMNDNVKENFKLRSKAIKLIRDFLFERGFLEVETPMMQPVYGGAFARPFITHHNTLDMDLYLRIAPELYLKRLLIGGFEKVFELNRNFRNEGISTKHNPEFTMLELYEAYADYNKMMDLCEELITFLVKEIKNNLEIEYQGIKLSFERPWKRIKYVDAIKEFTGIDFLNIKNLNEAINEAKKLGLEIEENFDSKWELADKIFGSFVEDKLIQPCFVIDYPKVLSPLAKSKKDNEEFVERFEPYIAGSEIGNAFSELNDPIEQKKRFEEQKIKREKGNLEAHPMDEDFVVALEYGMPPAGGLGIGIDRIIMILTNTSSIRDIILFPLLRKK